MHRARLCTALLLVIAAAVSPGMVAAAGSRSGRVVVPPLEGLSVAQAQRLLAVRGLRLGGPRFAPTPGSSGPVVRLELGADANRHVTVQDRRPGTRVTRGTRIDVGTRHVAGRGRGLLSLPFFVATISPDQRLLTGTATLGGLGCLTLDHLELHSRANEVVVDPNDVVGSSIRLVYVITDRMCAQRHNATVRLVLPHSLRARTIPLSRPARPLAGLTQVAAAEWNEREQMLSSDIVNVQFGPSSDCGLLAGTAVRETATAVRITLLAGNVHPGFCLDDLIFAETTVRLHAPIGTRRLIDDSRATLGTVTVTFTGCCGRVAPRRPGAQTASARWLRLLDADGNTTAIAQITPGQAVTLKAPRGTYTVTAGHCSPARAAVQFTSRPGTLPISCPSQ